MLVSRLEEAFVRRLSWLFTVLVVFVFGTIGSCAVAQDERFSARSADGRVEFHVTEATVRTAFQSYCESAVEARCDEFDRYEIVVVFDAELFRLSFSHEDPRTAPRNSELSILCTYTSRGRECASGRQE